MGIRTSRIALATAASTLLLAAALAGCAGSPSTSPGAGDGPAATSGPAGPDAGGSSGGEAYGCTDGILDYLKEHGFPEPEPLDPATISIPEAAFSGVPDCYIVDEYGGAPRYSAIWAGGGAGVLADLGAALTAGGYVQSSDYGPNVWWFDGEEPTTAAHALSAAEQPIDGADTLWVAW